MRTFIITLGAFVGAFVIFLSGAIVWSAWSEPTATPPNGNVAAPLNTGSATQQKTGDIMVDNLWSEDADVWITQIMKLHLFALQQSSGWPNGYTMLSNPHSSGYGVFLGIASLPWSVNGQSILPPGVLPARVKALVVRVRCQASAFFASDGPIAGGSATEFPLNVCHTDGSVSEGDTNDFVVPVFQVGGESSFKFRYRYDRFNAGGEAGTLNVTAVGLYYQ